MDNKTNVPSIKLLSGKFSEEEKRYEANESSVRVPCILPVCTCVVSATRGALICWSAEVSCGG